MLKRRTVTDLAFDGDLSARLRDDAVGRGKPKAGALAHAFSGEERLEDLLQIFRRNADAGISDLDDDMIGGPEIDIGELAGLLLGQIVSLEDRAARRSAWHRAH